MGSDNVIEHTFGRIARDLGAGPPVDPPGGGGDDGGMEARLRDVEQSIARIDATLPTLATKADLGLVEGGLRAEIHKAISEQTWKFVTWVSLIGGAMVTATFFIARNVH